MFNSKYCFPISDSHKTPQSVIDCLSNQKILEKRVEERQGLMMLSTSEVWDKDEDQIKVLSLDYNGSIESCLPSSL
jgi:hypothetical protein